MLNSATMAFKFICFYLAINLMVKQIIRYAENQDKPVITYRKFTDSPEDYPTMSFCLGGNGGTIYTDKTNELYVSPEEYSLREKT